MNWKRLFHVRDADSEDHDDELEQKRRDAAARAIRRSDAARVRNDDKWQEVKKVTEEFALAVERALRNPR